MRNAPSRTAGETRATLWRHGQSEHQNEHSSRAISSVADVSLALVVILACVALFVAFLDTEENHHDPDETAHTAETLGSSTLSVTYSVESALETTSEHIDDENIDSDDLTRAAHGPMAGLLARGAVTDARFDTEDGVVRPLGVGDDYPETVTDRLAGSLAGANHETNVTAVWEPFAGSSVRGTIHAGDPPPHNTDTTVVTTTVASGLPAVRTDAIARVENQTAGYETVARLVAEAIVNETFTDAQRALESRGVERAVTLSQYLRFADAIGIDPEYASATPDLSRHHVDTAAMNAHLVNTLSAQFAHSLEETFDTPERAAESVSTGEVTVSVTTWGTA